ncbi:hypothetical protein AURDEDRAFT_175183 [Auricularia subglabra TFB-10046 SS5]|nr:hypothetical protein AURDEDRAFT_175183 [Auricularia subglabra TFB-10046 SS5]
MQPTGAFVVLSVLFALPGVSASAGFGLTCTDIHLTGDGAGLNIAATCGNERGGNSGEQVLSLNSCLVNNDGEFACEFDGAGPKSCTACTLGGDILTVITCNCVRANGATSYSASFDLNTCIGNNDGVLVCP